MMKKIKQIEERLKFIEAWAKESYKQRQVLPFKKEDKPKAVIDEWETIHPKIVNMEGNIREKPKGVGGIQADTILVDEEATTTTNEEPEGPIYTKISLMDLIMVPNSNGTIEQYHNPYDMKEIERLKTELAESDLNCQIDCDEVERLKSEAKDPTLNCPSCGGYFWKYQFICDTNIALQKIIKKVLEYLKSQTAPIGYEAADIIIAKAIKMLINTLPISNAKSNTYSKEEFETITQTYRAEKKILFEEVKLLKSELNRTQLRNGEAADLIEANDIWTQTVRLMENIRNHKPQVSIHNLKKCCETPSCINRKTYDYHQCNDCGTVCNVCPWVSVIKIAEGLENNVW